MPVIGIDLGTSNTCAAIVKDGRPQVILDEKGRCLTANMTDYGVPMISEAPEDFKAVLIDVNDKFGPFGAKSISEIACNGAAPAIGIAIHDACGVWIRNWPMTPEKVLKALGRF